jgi:hypothetical protein
MPITRCVSSSSISCKILPDCRSSFRQAANRTLDPTFGWRFSAGPHRHRSYPVVDQISQQPVDRKYLGRANTLLWYVRSSEGLAFGLKPASITDLYHARPSVFLKS